MKKFTIPLILLLLLAAQCKKEGNAALDVSAISSTDLSGNATGDEDKTDWTLDNNWNDRENTLFVAPPILF